MRLEELRLEQVATKTDIWNSAVSTTAISGNVNLIPASVLSLCHCLPSAVISNRKNAHHRLLYWLSIHLSLSSNDLVTLSLILALTSLLWSKKS